MSRSHVKKQKRPASVRDRSTGQCGVCSTEQKLDDETGLVVTHYVKRDGKKVRCQGSSDYPTRVLHDPALAIGVRATIHEQTARKASTVRPPAKKSTARKPPGPGRVTVTRVDPKVWADAVRQAKRLGLPPSSIEVVFRVRESVR